MVVISRASGISQAAGEYQIWTHLARRDLRVRYSRTRLGPWWSSISLGALIFGISIATALIAQDPIREYLPRVAVSLLVWTFFSNILLESIELFSVERGILLNTRVHELSLILRVVYRQLLLSLYNLPVVFVCVIAGGSQLTFRLLLLPVLLLVAGLGLILPSFLIAMLTLLRRDFAQIIPSAVQLMFFVSPVMWETPSTGRLSTLAQINPIAWMLEATRALTLGEDPVSVTSVFWFLAIALSLVLIFIVSPMVRHIRIRI
jgi:lipopolysaccharide transport system permease protein